MRSAVVQMMCVAAAMVLAACGPDLATGSENLCPASDSPPSGLHRLYLDFNGETMLPGSDDATQSESGLLLHDAVIPAMNRTPDEIEAVVGSVRASLAPFDVEIVTERPAEGAYDMIVFGGESDRVMGQPGLQFAGPITCQAAPDSQVAFVFDVRKPLEALAANAIGLYAVMHGATTTAQPGDCLCLSDAACSASATRCTFGSNVPGSKTSECRPLAHVNSEQQMVVAFGCRQ